jgi:hypothetical protein
LVEIVEVHPDDVTVRLGGSYGARVKIPKSACRPPWDSEAERRVELKRELRVALGLHPDSPLARGLNNASTAELLELYVEHVQKK